MWVLTNAPQVLPAYPQSKLWENSFDLLNKDTASFQQISADYKKYKIPLRGNFHDQAQAIKAIFVLDKQAAAHVETTELKGVEKIAILRKESYRKKFIFGEHIASHLKQCASIANSCPIYSISRPADENSLADVMSFITNTVTNIGYPQATSPPTLKTIPKEFINEFI